MPSMIDTRRIADLLLSPREDLHIEIKNWLDLKSNNDHKATIAKAILAIANHGGGFVILGLSEENARFTEASDRPADLSSYNQDIINGIVQSYADPHFHCEVQLATDPAGSTFPIICVPGGHRSPIRAKKSGPHGNIVEVHSIYIRKPGPKSEVPQAGIEWDDLLNRCLLNRRNEMLDQIRDLISGVATQAQPETAGDTLERWILKCIERHSELVSALPQSSGARFPKGFYWFAYEIQGTKREIGQDQFPEILRESVVNHTGWPLFLYPNRSDIEPYPFDGAIECWLGELSRSDTGPGDPAHSDFWRISPDGYAFLMRGFQEDSPGMANSSHQPIIPGTEFDITLPVWRLGEGLLHAEKLATKLFDSGSTVKFAAHYDGLAGRKLVNIEGRRLMYTERVARQNSIRLATTVSTDSISGNLPEIVQPMLAPLYQLFAFMNLSMQLVVEELGRLRTGRF